MFDLDVLNVPVFECRSDVLTAVPSGFSPTKQSAVIPRTYASLDTDDENGTTLLEGTSRLRPAYLQLLCASKEVDCELGGSELAGSQW